MRVLVLFIGLSWLSGQTVPQDELAGLLRKAGEYSLSYAERFRELVATEESVQMRYDRKRKARKRTLLSDYYVIALPSDPGRHMEFRDTLKVDGKPVGNRRQEILELLSRKSGDLQEELKRIMKENNRYAPGALRTVYSYTDQGLSYFSPRAQANSAYKLLGYEEWQGRRAARVGFREVTARTVATCDQAPCPATGTAWISPEDGALLRIDYTFQAIMGQGRFLIEYQPGPDGLWVPEHYRDLIMDTDFENPAPGSWGTEAHYSNYRRFQADTEIKFGEPVP